jgi:acyl-CoA thioesterase-1
MGADYAGQFDAVFPHLAKKYGTVFYPFYLEGVALDPKLMQRDGLHPNPDGVAEIVKRILPKAEELIERAKAAQ